MALSGDNHCLDGTSLGPHGPIRRFAIHESISASEPTAIGRYAQHAGYGFHAPTDTSKNWYMRNWITTSRLMRGIASRSRAPWPTKIRRARLFSRYRSGDERRQLQQGADRRLFRRFVPTLVNSFRYGFVAKSKGTLGDSNQPWNYLQAFSQASRIPTPINGRSTTSRTIFPGTTASTPGSSAFSSRFCVIPKVT